VRLRLQAFLEVPENPKFPSPTTFVIFFFRFSLASKSIFVFIALGNIIGPVIYNISPSSGPWTGQTLIEISGAHFGASPKDLVDIRVQNVQCKDVTWKTSSFATCRTPVSIPRTYGPVVVQTFQGGSSPANATYSYNPAPWVSRVSPDNGPQQGGTRVTITGANYGSSRDDILLVSFSGKRCTDIEYISE